MRQNYYHLGIYTPIKGGSPYVWMLVHQHDKDGIFFRSRSTHADIKNGEKLQALVQRAKQHKAVETIFIISHGEYIYAGFRWYEPK